MLRNRPGYHLRYWIIPLVVLVPLLIMYFSGVKWAQEIVCPSVNWELGIVENLQILLLIMILVINVMAVFRKRSRIEKVIFTFLSVFTLFVLLEEIDYGAHFLRYFKGRSDTFFVDMTGKANVHNLGNNARIFKRSIYPLMLVLFIITPLYIHRLKKPVFKYLIPNKWFVITAIITIFSYAVPRLLVDFKVLEDGGFGVNIGEFSEIMVYYIFFLYLYVVIFEKELNFNQLVSD
ncbi:MAG: hypothetical protein AB9888_13420 [Bacteroidales bacterium]